jgi:protein-S-isoprenylcysteine O-methyltransferase Ste14
MFESKDPAGRSVLRNCRVNGGPKEIIGTDTTRINAITPKRSEDVTMEYFALVMLWITWCAIHSGMISLTVTNRLKQLSGNYYRFYRLFFNIVAVVTLVPLMVYSRSFKGTVLFRWEGCLTIVQGSLLIVVLMLFISGGLKYDLLQFMGLRQIRSGNRHAVLTASGEIDTSGVLSITRHPWYLAAIILIWINVRIMYVSTFIVDSILTAYLIIGTLLEERKLVLTLGDAYRDYQKKVSMLFPFKWVYAKAGMGKKTNTTHNL